MPPPGYGQENSSGHVAFFSKFFIYVAKNRISFAINICRKELDFLQGEFFMTENIKRTKSWDELTFADNFLFCKILESEPEICRQLLELLLHVEIDHLEVPQAEKTMQETIEAKSVRFDVYTKNDSQIFDIEIQTTDTKNLPKRARYYQSVIDMDNLSKGENYSKLKDSYVIFLCLDDIFHQALPVYTFENLCREDKKTKLKDGAIKVFFNAAECDKLKTKEERDFFHFLKGESAGTGLSQSILEKVEFAKKNMTWRRQYMTWQQTIDEEKYLAREEGARENAIANAKNFLNENISPETIARCCSLPLDEVLALKKELAHESVIK